MQPKLAQRGDCVGSRNQATARVGVGLASAMTRTKHSQAGWVHLCLSLHEGFIFPFRTQVLSALWGYSHQQTPAVILRTP